MAITQPGDTTVISFVSVPGDAGPATRAESVQGGYVALTGSGPPDATRLPLVMRRVGELVYTPTDDKFWQLIGGTADANWALKPFGKGGLITVATNSDRDALPAGIRQEGMIVYSQQTACYYALGADLSTWTFADAHPALALQSDWYINSSTGSDTNSGKTGSPLSTIEELCRRLCPHGSILYLAQSTTVHIAAGTYNALELGVSSPPGSGFNFDVRCDFTSSSPITLSSVVDTVPHPTSAVRGRIQTASGAFADKARIRSTSGAVAGAITYCTGLTSSTDAWVKSWVLDLGASLSVGAPAVSTTCVVDTLQVTIKRVQIRTTGGPLGGAIRVWDAILPQGAEFQNMTGGSSSAYLSQCLIGGTSAVSRLSGNMQVRNSRILGTGITGVLGTGIVVLSGCVIENTFQSFIGTQFFTANCFNGGVLQAETSTVAQSAGIALGDCEWVNGGALAVFVGPAYTVEVIGQQFGFGTPYSIGYKLAGGAKVVADTLAYATGLPATQPVTMAGQNVAYTDLPRALGEAECSFVLLNDATARVAITSAFGRLGRTLVAVLGDYTSSLVTNSSTVSGATVTNALDTLKASVTALVTGVSSFNTRTGAVVAALNDYTSSLIQNLSTVTGGGSTVTSALNALQSQITAAVTGVSSWNSRTGAVTPASGDYTSTQVTNSSGVTGATVTAALNALSSAISALVTGVSSYQGRTGAINAVTGDYNSNQVNNVSAVAGISVSNALNTLNSAISALVTGVSSWNGRGGAVVPVANDYNTTQINNVTAIPGSTLSAALATLRQEFLFMPAMTGNLTVTNFYSKSCIVDVLASPGVLTIPLETTHGFVAGEQFSVANWSGATSAITITPASGVTLINLSKIPLGLPQLPTGTILDFLYIGGDNWSVSVRPTNSDTIGNASSVAGNSVSQALNALLAFSFNGWMSIPLAGHTGVASDWSFYDNFGWIDDHPFGPGISKVRFAIGMIPIGALFTELRVLVAPSSAHGALPAVPIEVQLWKGASSLGGATMIRNTVDLTTPVSAYNAPHEIILSGWSTARATPDTTYWMVVIGESGSNSLSGTQLLGAKILLQ